MNYFKFIRLSGFIWVSLVLAVFLNACGSTPTSTPPTTIKASPRFTPTPLARPTATPAPTPTVTPVGLRTLVVGKITYQFEKDVTAEQAKYIQEGVELGQKNLGEVGEVLVRAGKSLVSPARSKESIGAIAKPGLIEIYTANITNYDRREWLSLVVHEYYHLVQYDLKGNNLNKLVPAWLEEGTADYIAFKVLNSASIANFNQVKSLFQNEARAYKMPLNQLETDEQSLSAGAASYSLGFLAMDFLSTKYKADKDYFKPFFSALGKGETWQVAFKQNFGVAPDEFYKQFEEHRTKNFPPK
jgi:hypothetical protein